MENPEKDIHSVLREVISTDADRVVKEVQRVYTEDSEWEHPLFIWKGRDTIIEVYQFYALVNRRFENLRVIDATFNPQHGRICVDLSVEFQPFLYPLKQTARLLVLYDLVKVDTQGGRTLWKIKRQEDLWLPERFVAAVLPEPFGGVAGSLVSFALLVSGFNSAYLLSPVLGVVSRVLRTLVWGAGNPPPTWTGPLVDPEKEASVLVQAILNTETPRVATVVDRTFAEGAAFDHPLAKFVGKHMIKRLYMTWSQAAWVFKDHTVSHVSVNDKKDRLYLDVMYSAYLYLLLFPASARIVTILHLKPMQPKGYQITRQQDFIQPSRLITAMVSGPIGHFLSSATRVLQCVIGTSIARLILPIVTLFLSVFKFLFDL